MVYEGMSVLVLFCQFPQVAVYVVGLTAFGFQLNGHVFDAEVRGDSVLDQLQQLSGSAMVVDHHMAGQHDQARFHCPDVKVVYVLDAGNRLHGRCDVRDADTWRSRFQQDIHRFFKDRPSSSENDPDDQQADERVQNSPACEENRPAADDDSERHPGVSQHVPECTSDIQIVLRSMLEQQGDAEIGHKTDGGHGHNPCAVDRNRVQKSLHADDGNPNRG